MDRKLIYIICSVAMILPLLLNHAEAKFLLDDDYESETKGDTSGYPVDVALNISVDLVPGELDSVRITWDYSAKSSGLFIIGRTTRLPESKASALSAVSLKVVDSTEKRIFIDRNIPEGEYYYVILSKNKIKKDTIELYPNENYITNSVKISKKVENDEHLPQIKNLKATVINNRKVVLSWLPLSMQGVTYNIYRYTEPIISSDVLKKAEKITSLKDSDIYSDAAIKESGKYYYAVTTTDGIRKEDTALKPDQSYTSKASEVNLTVFSTVSGLTVEPVSSGQVKVSWENYENFQGEYLLYRSGDVIDSPAKLGSSMLVQRFNSNQSSYVDKNIAPGKYYYALFLKDERGDVIKKFLKDSNYTSQPVEIGALIRVRKINSDLKPDGVHITWDYTGDTGDRIFKLYRSRELPGEIENISDYYFVESVDIGKKLYIDKAVPDGNYYYIIVPDNYNTIDSFKLVSGVNFTQNPIKMMQQESEIDNSFRLRLILADVENEKVQITWKYSGKEGMKYYKLYRSQEKGKLEDLESFYFVDNVDVTSGSYLDDAVPDGKYYYYLVPDDYKGRDNFKMIKGIHYISEAVTINRKKNQNQQKNDIDKSDIKIPEDSFNAESINQVLRDYFYKGKYSYSRKALFALLEKSNSQNEKAYIRFYIGRTYAAERKYRTALKYFLNRDVKKYYPDQSRFWSDYCFMRTGR